MSVASFCVSNIAVNICVRTLLHRQISVLCVYYCCQCLCTYGCQLHRFVCLILLSMFVYVHCCIVKYLFCVSIIVVISVYVLMSVASFCVSNIAVKICVRTLLHRQISVLCVYYCCHCMCTYGCQLHRFVCLILLSISVYVHCCIVKYLSLIHISEPTRRTPISY